MANAPSPKRPLPFGCTRSGIWARPARTTSGCGTWRASKQQRQLRLPLRKRRRSLEFLSERGRASTCTATRRDRPDGQGVAESGAREAGFGRSTAHAACVNGPVGCVVVLSWVGLCVYTLSNTRPREQGGKRAAGPRCDRTARRRLSARRGHDAGSMRTGLMLAATRMDSGCDVYHG